MTTKTLTLKHDMGAADRPLTVEHVTHMLTNSRTGEVGGEERAQWFADHLLACGYSHMDGRPVTGADLLGYIGR